jgi:outer membrane protein assembly factor BamB
MKKLPLLLCLSLLSGCSWMKFWEGDDAESKVAPAKLTSFDEEIRIQRLWARSAGSGQDPLFSGLVPAIADGRVYAAGSKGTVVAVSAATGEVLWRRELDETRLSGGVGHGGGMVLVGDLEGRLHALDADTGRLLWERFLGSEIISAPAANDRVVAVQTVDDTLLGLNAGDGSQLWQYDAETPNLTLRGTSSPLVTSTMAITGFANGKIVALNAGTGSLLWESRVAVPKGRTELERMVDIDGSPLLAEDVVYVTSYQGRAAAMSRGTGRELWLQEISSHQQPGYGLDQVYITETDDTLTALRANSGQVLWSNDQLTYRKLTAPVYVNGYVAVADADGYLHVLSPVDGRLVGRTKVDGSGVSSAMVTDGESLYVLDNDGDIKAYSLKAR